MTLAVWRPLMRRTSVLAMGHHCVLFYLLIHALLPHERLATVCPVLGSACRYSNTYASSTKIMSVRERDIFPSSCLSFCAEKEECIGVNENIDSDICEILEDDDIITGLEWFDSQSHDFWSFEEPCPKVKYCVAIIPKVFPIFRTCRNMQYEFEEQYIVKTTKLKMMDHNSRHIHPKSHTQWLQQMYTCENLYMRFICLASFFSEAV